MLKLNVKSYWETDKFAYLNLLDSITDFYSLFYVLLTQTSKAFLGFHAFFTH